MAIFHSIRFTVATLFVLSVCSATAQKYQFSWDDGGSNHKYENPENWNTDTIPARSGKDKVSLLIDGGTMIFDELSGKQNIDVFDMNNGAVLYMKGGVFEHSRSGNYVRSSIGTSGQGLSIVNQSGGEMSIGHTLRIGFKQSNGQYNLTGGDLYIYRGGRSPMDVSHSTSFSLGSSNSESDFTISGGTFYTRAGVEIGPKATFSVKGNGATAIGIGSVKEDNPGSWHQVGTLSCGVGPRGISKIYIATGTGSEPFVRFLKGSKLDLNFHGTRPINGAWIIMELEGAAIEDEGLALSEASSENPGWTFEIDNSGPNGRLIAKYKHYVGVPEVRQYSLFLSLLIGVFAFCRRQRV